MPRDKPKECSNSQCKVIFYKPDYLLHQALICEKCQEKDVKDD